MLLSYKITLLDVWTVKLKTRASRRFKNYRRHRRFELRNGRKPLLTNAEVEDIAINLWPINETPPIFPIGLRLYHG